MNIKTSTRGSKPVYYTAPEAHEVGSSNPKASRPVLLQPKRITREMESMAEDLLKSNVMNDLDALLGDINSFLGSNKPNVSEEVDAVIEKHNEITTNPLKSSQEKSTAFTLNSNEDSLFSRIIRQAAQNNFSRIAQFLIQDHLDAEMFRETMKRRTSTLSLTYPGYGLEAEIDAFSIPNPVKQPVKRNLVTRQRAKSLNDREKVATKQYAATGGAKYHLDLGDQTSAKGSFDKSTESCWDGKLDKYGEFSDRESEEDLEATFQDSFDNNKPKKEKKVHGVGAILTDDESNDTPIDFFDESSDENNFDTLLKIDHNHNSPHKWKRESSSSDSWSDSSFEHEFNGEVYFHGRCGLRQELSSREVEDGSQVESGASFWGVAGAMLLGAGVAGIGITIQNPDAPRLIANFVIAIATSRLSVALLAGALGGGFTYKIVIPVVTRAIDLICSFGQYCTNNIKVVAALIFIPILIHLGVEGYANSAILFEYGSNCLNALIENGGGVRDKVIEIGAYCLNELAKPSRYLMTSILDILTSPQFMVMVVGFSGTAVVLKLITSVVIPLLKVLVSTGFSLIKFIISTRGKLLFPVIALSILAYYNPGMLPALKSAAITFWQNPADAVMLGSGSIRNGLSFV